MHAKKSHVIEATTKKCRWILMSLLPCDFALTVVLMTRPQEADSDTTFEESEDLNLEALRLITSSMTALLSIISLFIVIPRFKFLITRRMIAVFVLRVVAVLLLVPQLAYPNTLRTTLNVMILFFIFVELILVCVVFVKLSKVNKAFYGKKQREHSVTMMLKDVKQNPTLFVENLDDWLMLKESRKMLRRKYNVAQAGWALACAAVFVIGITIFVTEFAKIASTQKTLYSDSVIEEMNLPAKISYYPNVTRDRSSQPKVFVVVLDGMRYDYLHVNSDMESLFLTPEVARDSKIFKMNAQLPSMSVPNWMTILTGAPPEATGVLGNLLVPETKFDSMFRSAANYDLHRGLTGSPWFAGIIDSTLPFLDGDGTIPTTLGAHGSDTSDVADNERANVAKYALTEQYYPLFLAHFSDIDIQGHCCGVTKKYNDHDTYYDAATNKSAILREIIGWLDNQTTLVIVADHGHVDRGGHGGTNKHLIEVPLIIYKKDSFIGNRTFNGPRFVEKVNNFDLDEEVHYSNVDVAPTVCALLGIPVPRQTHGKFIDDAMLLVDNSSLSLAYYDLYQQKKQFVNAYIHTAGINTKYTPPELGPNLDLKEYVKAVEQMITEREKMRKGTIKKEQARNVVITTVVLVGAAACLTFLLQSVTFCDPLSMFSLKHTWVRRQNRIAAVLGFGTVFLYYGLSILIYYIAFVVIGYDSWDSTVIHYPAVLTRFALLCLVPAALVIYNIVRIVHVYYSLLPQVTWSYFSPIVNPLFFGRNPILKDPALIYLYRYYLCSWVVVSWILLMIMQSSYTFIIPPVFAIKYITPSLWVFRFRVITVQLMSLPIVITSLILLFFGFPSRNPNRPHFDSIYALKIAKDFRIAGHPSALENLFSDVSAEDPILQDHKNAIFYSAILQESAKRKFESVNTIYEVTSLNGESSGDASKILVRDPYEVREEEEERALEEELS